MGTHKMLRLICVTACLVVFALAQSEVPHLPEDSWIATGTPIVRHHITPGAHAHCLEVTTTSDNAWWKSHGYTLSPPEWSPGQCDRKIYNWHNKFETIAPGVTQETRGIHTTTSEAGGMEAMEAMMTTGFVHQLITVPGFHCLEIEFPGGKTSPFWKSDGWKYGPPVRPEWKDGACDKTKWNEVDATKKDYDGWNTAKNGGLGSVIQTKYGIKSAAKVESVVPMASVRPEVMRLVYGTCMKDGDSCTGEGPGNCCPGLSCQSPIPGSQYRNCVKMTPQASVATQQLADSIQDDQRSALMTFYSATNGAAWTNNAGWGKAADMCTWYGVVCNHDPPGTSQVVSIKLSNNNLSGAIPEAMFPKLPRLKTLELNHNNLSGAVPSNLASLKELQFVHLQNNKLSGGLPATMMNLEVRFPPMQEIDLSYNMLTGTIPDTLFGPEKPGTFAPSVNLKVLNLRYNSLTGNIPSRITRDNIMVSMLVGGNKMSGTVDPVVGKWLSQRKYCDLSGNQWKCPLPAGVADKRQAACKPSMVTEVAPLTNAIKCNTSPKMKKVVVTNKLRPSIKFRTCSKVRDPKTGWACNHG